MFPFESHYAEEIKRISDYMHFSPPSRVQASEKKQRQHLRSEFAREKVFLRYFLLCKKQQAMYSIHLSVIPREGV
jgi:hypothetical protein